jgi:hypothetical protein
VVGQLDEQVALQATAGGAQNKKQSMQTGKIEKLGMYSSGLMKPALLECDRGRSA